MLQNEKVIWVMLTHLQPHEMAHLDYAIMLDVLQIKPLMCPNDVSSLFLQSLILLFNIVYIHTYVHTRAHTHTHIMVLQETNSHHVYGMHIATTREMCVVIGSVLQHRECKIIFHWRWSNVVECYLQCHELVVEESPRLYPDIELYGDPNIK